MNIINIFLIYSILGNIFERVVMHISHTSYISGFMGTIFTPLYGIAILVILFIHKKVDIKNIFLRLLIELFIFSIVLSLLELLGGIMIEKIFNKIYWNYDNMKYNIGKYISLETGLFWGIMSLVVIYMIHPIINKLIKYIPRIITIGVSIIFIVNFIYILIVKLT